MNDFDLNTIKYKPIDISRLLLAIDRLTRFKNTEEKYLRVFKDILINNLIYPKFKKSELDVMDYSALTSLASYVINESLNNVNIKKIKADFDINVRLKEYEEKIFRINNNAISLLNNNINYEKILALIQSDSPNNLKWLKELAISENPEISSLGKGFHFPIKKIIICEGLTEEILLPVFANVLGYNFDKNGVHIISAGGKNQVVKLYYKYAEQLKIPIFVLLDSDAEENTREIEPKLRKQDKIYRIKTGEFEDLLPEKLIEKALNFSIKNISEAPIEHYHKSESAVEYLEEFYKKRGAHEFKKAEFAQIVKENISGIEDISPEITSLINAIM